MFCPKCGNQVPDTAAFCGKCGHQFDTAPARMSSAPASANVVAAAPSAKSKGTVIMPIARAIMSVAAFVLLFMPWATYNYQGAITGRSTTDYTFVDLCSGKYGIFLIAMAAGLAIILLFSVTDLASKKTWGRWLCLIGAIIVIAISVLFGMQQGSSSSIGIASESVRMTSMPWACFGLGLLSGVSCFIKL